MRKFNKLFTLLLLTIVFVSCKNESLQQYLVDSQDKKGFITLDISSSVLRLNDEKTTEEAKETLNSIRKVNIAALPLKQATVAEYEKEKTELKKIFDKSQYKVLMKMKEKNINMTLYYTGETDAIDEIIVFGYGKQMGVGVARILGDNMNPNKILKMMQYIDVDGGVEGIGAFKNMVKNNI